MDIRWYIFGPPGGTLLLRRLHPRPAQTGNIGCLLECRHSNDLVDPCAIDELPNERIADAILRNNLRAVIDVAGYFAVNGLGDSPAEPIRMHRRALIIPAAFRQMRRSPGNHYSFDDGSELSFR